MTKDLIQCDFDGTITEDDVSFLMLDAFADGDWRQLLVEHKEGRMSVGRFNTRAFTMIKENKQTLDRFVAEKARLKPGFHELLAYCRQKGSRFVIVSNGLNFYIKTILATINVNNIEIYAAQARFDPAGIRTQYIGPDGTELQDGFKEAYIRYFLKSGYRIIYAGNGVSDISSARLAHHIFATSHLLAHCEETNLNCTPFIDLHDIVNGLDLLP
ncbi:MAG: MtnX-like HAD-IB family phosphatase [Dehalococcoidales bacterium]|jgi:2-hydroxy-3-keto-5-methylthiopentenyl-1-phosphate phosphatase|nr:MtnX-like HAD-IB family phosphatase [Dehalococcoidales bacterium]